MQSLPDMLQSVMTVPYDMQVPLLRSLGKDTPPGSISEITGDRTPLMMAAQHGCVEIMAYLLQEALADPNIRAPGDGSTALHCAAAGGSVRTLEAIGLLLNCGGDREVLDAAGRRPLDVLPNLEVARDREHMELNPGGASVVRIACREPPGMSALHTCYGPFCSASRVPVKRAATLTTLNILPPGVCA